MPVVAELLSLREYAARRGVSHTAVRKAAVGGRLGKAARQDEAGRWLIEPELADLEWDRRTDPSQQRGAARKATTRRKAKAAKRPAARRPKAPAKPVPAVEALEPEVGPVPGAEGDSLEDLEHQLLCAEGFSEVRTISEKMRARLLAIEHRVKSGALVDARVVRRSARNVAQTVREQLRSIPPAVCAELAAESDPTAILVRLELAIDDVLEELSRAD